MDMFWVSRAKQQMKIHKNIAMPTKQNTLHENTQNYLNACKAYKRQQVLNQGEKRYK